MTSLIEGEKVPSFKAVDQFGTTISTASLKGKPYLIYFYPQDDTPTCTDQACNLRDNFADLKKAGITVIGISPDDIASHEKFSKKFNLPFSIVPDPNHQIIKKFDVWGKKQMFGNTYMGLHRTSFLIDEKGTIRKIFLKPRSKQHAQEVLKAFQSLG
jgi:peroxiredoxin Q/BCP